MINVYSEKLFLTPQDILEKDFKIDARGYRPQEVDKYLDMIIRDYNELINMIKTKDKENRELIDDNNLLKKEIRYLKEQLEAKPDIEGNRGPTNIDLLKRISNLEKIVYGKEE